MICYECRKPRVELSEGCCVYCWAARAKEAAQLVNEITAEKNRLVTQNWQLRKTDEFLGSKA